MRIYLFALSIAVLFYSLEAQAGQDNEDPRQDAVNQPSWSSGWPRQLVQSLQSDQKRHTHRVGTFEELVLAAQPLDPDPVPNDWDNDAMWKNRADADRNPPSPLMPSVFADQSIGMTFFGVGIVGWVLLGLSVILLERRSSAVS